MISDDPPFLNEGDEVSAKYKGAFCEAIITNVQKRVECRVTLKHDQKTSIFYDSDIKGTLKVGSIVEVKKDQNKYAEGTIVKMTDQSMYTVVFDDGDRNTLKRSKLCPKGDRHFTKSNSLDGLPLTNPEHFWSPVKKDSRAKSSTNTGSESDSDDEYDEDCRRQFSKSEEESSDSKSCEAKVKQKTEEEDKCSADGEDKKSSTWWLDAYQDMIGKVVNVEVEDKVKKQMQIVPALVCLPNADDNKTVLTPGHMLVKSFKDSKFMAVQVSCARNFTASLVTRTCKWTRSGLEKAQQFDERSELPGDWDKKELLGLDEIENSSDEEQNEKKDRFVAELYRFMEERGTPINKVPSIIPGVDVNLCSLYRAVQTLGGFNKVTNLMKWNVVVNILNFKSDVTASKVKEAYKKFLHAFEEIDKRLGCNMIMTNKVRSTPGRNLPSLKEKEVEGKKEVKSKKSVAIDEIELKSPSSPHCATNSSSDPRNVSTPIAAKSGKKVKETQKISPTTSDTPNRPHKNTRNDSESHKTTESNSSSSAKVGKVLNKDSTPKSLRKLSRDEVERRGKEEEKSSPPQSHSNPNLMKKVGDVKKTSNDDINRSKLQNKASVKHFKASEVDVGKMERMRSSSKVDWSEEAKKSEKLEKVAPTCGRRTLRRMASSSTSDDVKMQDACDGASSVAHNRRKSDDILGPGTRVVVRYGKGKVAKTYEAKILEVDMKQGLLKYLVHYNGWNSRYDEWLEREEIVNVLEFIQPSPSDLLKVKNPSHHAKAPRKKLRMAEDNVSSLKHKKTDDYNYHQRGGYDDHPRVGRKRKTKIMRSTTSNESNEQNVTDEELINKDASDDDDDEEEDDKESMKDLQSGNNISSKVEEMIEKQSHDDEMCCNDDLKKEEEVYDTKVDPSEDVQKQENEFKDEEPMLDRVDDEDVLNNSGLGPPTLFSSHEMEEEFSGHLRDKRLSSSTDCLPCLINEKDVAGTTNESCEERMEAEILNCAHVTAEHVIIESSDNQIETAEIKVPKRPGRKRKISEADDGFTSHIPNKSVEVETRLITKEMHDETIIEETACESELMDESVQSSEKLNEPEVLLESSSQELSQLQGEWSDGTNAFNDVVDCTLLSQFANECTKESDNMISNMLTISADNSPPETSSDDCCLEPAEVTVGDEDEEEDDDDEDKDEEEGGMVARGDDEEGSTRSEREANQEVASYMKHSKSPLQPIIDSPSANEFSTASNDSCSAGLGRKVDVVGQQRLKRKKSQESGLVPVRKKLKKEGGCVVRRKRSRGNNNLSESDGESSPQHHSTVRATPTKVGMLSKQHSTPNKSIKFVQHHKSSNMKDKNLNFLDLEEGKYLIGEERIDFIMKKITQLKVAYMELKSELACLDRRRRRHRMKEGRRSVIEKEPSLCSSRNNKLKRRREDDVGGDDDDDGDRMLGFLDNQKSDAVDLSLATETVSEHNSVGGILVVNDIEIILEAFDFNKPHSLALKKIINKFIDSNDIGILSDLANCFMENLNSIDHRQARLNECLDMLDAKVRREVESEDSDSESNDSDYDDEYANSPESASTCSEMCQRSEGIALMS